MYCHLHALGEEDLLGHALLDDLLEVLVLLVLLPQPQVLLLEGADLQHSTVQCSAVQYSTVQNRTAQTFLSRETSTSVTTIRETVSRATFHRYLHMRSEVIMYTSGIGIGKPVP